MLLSMKDYLTGWVVVFELLIIIVLLVLIIVGLNGHGVFNL